MEVVGAPLQRERCCEKGPQDEGMKKIRLQVLTISFHQSEMSTCCHPLRHFLSDSRGNSFSNLGGCSHPERSAWDKTGRAVLG